MQLDTRYAETWRIAKSEDLYGIRNWGKGYFSINDQGHVAVHPDKDPNRSVDLKTLVDDIRVRGIQAPMLLRFTDILQHRLRDMHGTFAQAAGDCGYRGKYCCVYPIKVNQQRHVVEEIYQFGKEFGFGLEAGSKSELLAVLALVDDESTPIICNGFKDEEYIEAVVVAQKIGKKAIPVIEKIGDLHLLADQAAAHGVFPFIGVRTKLASRGSGRWESSGGQTSKFGLHAAELIEVLDFLKSRDLVDRLALLHFHIGSQITNIRSVKDAVNEAARIYVELYRAGAKLEYLDVGGGLGIDYDGSQTNFGSSVNYTLGEYASDVMFGIQSVCDQANVPHPIIVTESGRAITAYYSVLIFNVVGVSEIGGKEVPPRPPQPMPPSIQTLFDTLGDLTEKNVLEMFHDAVKSRDDAQNLFNLGYLSLEQRSLAEKLFWTICRAIYKITLKMEYVPDELHVLEPMLADTYFCNYSVFQSMPDSWAVHQLFPIMPIHRLDERPNRRATLADLTCDSDGKVDRFIDMKDIKKVLELHTPNGDDYYLAAFLVGAYQEILGDLHNLFGDTHAVHVSLDDNGRPAIDTVVKGDTVREVLRYVQFSADELFGNLRRHVEKAVRSERITAEEAGKALKFFEEGLSGYTYLE